MAHTPGPWQYLPETQEIRSQQELIAGQVQRHNASVLVTAWKMLALLRVLVERSRLSVDYRDEALIVIAEAEGNGAQ